MPDADTVTEVMEPKPEPAKAREVPEAKNGPTPRATKSRSVAKKKKKKKKKSARKKPANRPAPTAVKKAKVAPTKKRRSGKKRPVKRPTMRSPDPRKPTWSLVTFAELDAWREQQEVPKNRMAHLLGVTNSTWHNWQRGQVVPTVSMQRRIRAVIDGDPAAAQALSTGNLERPLRAAAQVSTRAPSTVGASAIEAAAVEATGAIVAACLRKGRVKEEDLPGLIKRVFGALSR